jgi:hypothetical protein
MTTDIVHDELGVRLAFLQEEIDFLLWWKKKQGSIPPFLRLDIEVSDITNNWAPIVEGDGIAFILKYASSAQYLDIPPLFWGRIYEKFEIGDQVALANAHTLVTYGYGEQHGIKYYFYDAQFIIGLMPTHAPSALRRLVIDMDDPCHNTPIPNHWSTLTHLAMKTREFPLNFWFSLTRGLPDLQWVYIEFKCLTGIEECAKPTKCTLSHLSTLFIRSPRDDFGDSEEFPFSSLMTDLHLPVLRSLFLCSEALSWKDHHALTELYTVLQSTPAVRKLVIEDADFLGLDDSEYRAEVHAEIGDIQPIWSLVPNLVHLRLELPSTHHCSDNEAAKRLDTFIRNVFFSQTRWLDLDNSACPIRRIALVNNLDIPPSDPLLERIKKFTTSMARKHIKNRSNVTFKIISEPENFEPWTKWLR